MLQMNDINEKFSMCDLLALEYGHECDFLRRIWRVMELLSCPFTPGAKHDCSFHQHELSLDVARSHGRTDGWTGFRYCVYVCEWISANDQYVYS